MAGIDATTPFPTEIILHQQSRLLEVRFEDGVHAHLTHELLRVYSPSAEVRGHGVGQEVLQVGKRDVFITQVEPIGNYAVKLVFSDGHDSGLYSWDYLHLLARAHEALWAEYLRRLEEAQASRDPDAPVPDALRPPSGPACHH
jgi:DUF971 family protein